jgi:hypothetical protein
MKKIWITLLIILLIAGITIFALNKTTGAAVSEETAKYIGEHSVVYIQLGCHACEEQEKLFGDNWKYINVVDCFYTPDKCQNIQYTPTWLINGQYYVGVQSIETLENLTGCK